tara:strand:+ start:80 stop:307 length:228 start_codon:yes stop_codon:yes gene_type:complete
MDNSELEFVATGQLIRELQTRMDSMVFVGSSKRTDKEDALLFGVSGPLHCCLGLVEASKLMLISQGSEDDYDSIN